MRSKLCRSLCALTITVVYTVVALLGDSAHYFLRNGSCTSCCTSFSLAHNHVAKEVSSETHSHHSHTDGAHTAESHSAEHCSAKHDDVAGHSVANHEAIESSSAVCGVDFSNDSSPEHDDGDCVICRWVALAKTPTLIEVSLGSIEEVASVIELYNDCHVAVSLPVEQARGPPA